MADQGSSFIPKAGVTTVRKTRTTKRIYVLAYVSYIVFFSTLFAVIGIYIYGATVDRNLASLQEQMDFEQQRFAVADIESVEKLDTRVKKATELFEESSAPSRIFADIEAIVASNIYFSSFSYEQLPSRKFNIELIGRADNFDEVLVQRDFLSGSNILADAEVTTYDYSVSESEEGSLTSSDARLSFTFSDTRDLSVIAYQVGQSGAVTNSVEIEQTQENEVNSGTSTATVTEVDEGDSVVAETEATSETENISEETATTTDSGEDSSGESQ